MSSRASYTPPRKTMVDVAAEDLDYENQVPGIPLQRLFDDDLIEPPAAFREDSRVAMVSVPPTNGAPLARQWA